MRSPYRDTPLTVRAAFLFLIASIAINSADAKDLSDLFAAMDSHSVAIAQARTELADVQRQFQVSRAIPNPTLGYDHERVEVDDVTDKETVLAISQPLGFLWSYGANRAAARHALDAAVAGFGETRRELFVQAAAAGMELQAASRQLTFADTVLERTRGLVADMTRRYELGDVSEYDLHRLQAELVLMESEQRERLAENQVSANVFTQLTGLAASWCDDMSVRTRLDAPFQSEDEATEYALKQRLMLKQAEANQQAANSFHASAKRNQLPDISATLGRKTVSPSFDGIVVGAEIEIPIFSQRRSETRYARTRVNESKLINTAAAAIVEQEARQAYRLWQTSIAETPNRLGSTANLLADLDRGILMYVEGELSAADLVDLMRSGADVLAAQLNLKNAQLLSTLELRRITGLPLESDQ